MAFREVIDVENVAQLFLDSSNAWLGFYFLGLFAFSALIIAPELILTPPFSILFMLYTLLLTLILMAMVYMMFRISEITIVDSFRKSFILISLGVITHFFNAPSGFSNIISYGFIYPVSYLFYLLFINLNNILLGYFTYKNLLSIMGIIFSSTGFLYLVKALYELSIISDSKIILMGALLIPTINLVSPIFIGFGFRLLGFQLRRYLTNSDLMNNIKQEILNSFKNGEEIIYKQMAERHGVIILLPLILIKELRRSGYIDGKIMKKYFTPKKALELLWE